MVNGPPPIDDILKSKMWELTEMFTSKAFTRETAKKIIYAENEMIDALRRYFSNDNPNDLRWWKDYYKIYNKIGEIAQLPNEEDYLQQIYQVETKLYALIQEKYQEVFPVTDDYVVSDVSPDIMPDEVENNKNENINEIKEEQIDEMVEEETAEMEEKLAMRLHNFLIKSIKADIKSNKNEIIFFIGPPGSGKSYAALSLAETLDPNFSVDRVVFSVEEFMNVFMKETIDPVTGVKKQEYLPKGSAIIFDDAGLDINARDWQQYQAKIMGKLSQSMRYLNHIIIFTVPSATFIEKQTRTVVKFVFEADKEHMDLTGKIFKNWGRFKCFIQEFTKDGELLQKYPIITYNHRQVKLKYIIFQKPNQKLIEAYEQKKEDSLNHKYSDLRGEILAKKGMTKTYTDVPKTNLKPEEKGIEVTCPHCGYHWEYKGNKTVFIQCPQCRSRINLRKLGLVVAENEEKKDKITNYSSLNDSTLSENSENSKKINAEAKTK